MNLMSATSPRMDWILTSPELAGSRRSICVTSPVITAREFTPMRVRNIFICRTVVFCASSRMTYELCSVRPRMNASGAISMTPSSMKRRILSYDMRSASASYIGRRYGIHLLLHVARQEARGSRPPRPRGAPGRCGPPSSAAARSPPRRPRDRSCRCRRGRSRTRSSCSSSALRYSACVGVRARTALAVERVARRALVRFGERGPLPLRRVVAERGGDVGLSTTLPLSASCTSSWSAREARGDGLLLAGDGDGAIARA